MWDTQPTTGMRQKIKLVDGVSEGEVDLELHIKRDDKVEPRQHVTDDDVFKELINIVMDVFSNKSEKCMLTFELPVESDVLKEIRLADSVVNKSDVSSSTSKSDLVIPLRETKAPKKRIWKAKTKRKRKLIELIAKPSKCNKKKKFKRRLNSIVQTVLHSNSGFTDLEKLPRTIKHSKIHKFSSNTADDWDTEKKALLQEASNLRAKITHHSEDAAGSDAYGNLYNNFKEVLQSFGDTIKSQTAPVPSCELSYHIEEIQNHVEAIGNLLQDASSQASWEIHRHTSTESSEAPRRKNKVGVKLIRIGAKISHKSSMQIAPISNTPRKHKHRRRETTRAHSLDKILRQYQNVKKEETAIVQALLGKLGIQKDTKSKKICSEKKKEAIGEDQCRSNDKPSDKAQLNLKPSSPKTYSNSSKETFEDPLSKNDAITPKVRMLAKRFEHKFEVPKNKSKHRRQGRNRCDGEVKQRHQKVRCNMKKRASKNSLKCSSSVFDEIRKEVMGNLKENEIVKAGNCEAIGPQQGNKTQEALMRRIQSAAERLEQMHRVVEEKLNHLSLKEVQFQQQSHKTEVLTCTDSWVFGEGKMLENTQLNLSPEVEELIFCPYKPFNLEGDKFPESRPFDSSNLKVNSNFEAATTGKSPMNFDKDVPSFGRNPNYIFCNYMMEMRGEECELVSSGSLENQPGSEHNLGNVFSSTILTDEFQENSSFSKPKNEPIGVQSSLSSSDTKDVSTENSGEIVEESLFTKPRVSNKNSTKLQALKKKKRVIKTTCALS